jgi:NAD+-dependent protein deacetylase sirtuin 2
VWVHLGVFMRTGLCSSHAGAGISVSAGIPDFRTPGTGKSRGFLTCIATPCERYRAQFLNLPLVFSVARWVAGLYDNLAKYELPKPTAVFDLDFFRENPRPFFQLARELYPGRFKPTIAHYFLKLLADKGLLRRVYTQNIDTLEQLAGVPSELLVEAHGSFGSATCRVCGRKFESGYVASKIFGCESDEVVIPRCDAIGCDGIVKPDIVFFGVS